MASPQDPIQLFLQSLKDAFAPLSSSWSRVVKLNLASNSKPEGGAGNQLAEFAVGCFWSAELTFQRIEGVVKTEVGYSQGHLDKPTYKDVCTDKTGHSEVVRVHFDPTVCSYSTLLGVFWGKYTANREEADCCNSVPAKKFYPAEEYHQQYLEKGGQTKIMQFYPAEKFYPVEGLQTKICQQTKIMQQP